MNLLILGNGFDLHHGLPTKYRDFKDFIDLYLAVFHENENYEDKKDGRFSLMDLEIFDKKMSKIGIRLKIRTSIKAIETILEEGKSVLKVNGEVDTWSDFESFFHAGILYNSQFRVFNNSNNPNRLTELKAAIDNDNITYTKIDINKGERINSLNIFFTECFTEYLKIVTENCEKSANETIIKNIEDADIIVSFNYTQTHNLYSIKENCTIIHMHNQISENLTNIIGYDSKITMSDSFTRDSILSSTAFFSKNLQNKLFNEESEDLYSKLLLNDKILGKVKKISIIGWSYGKSDGYFFDLFESILRLPNTNTSITREELDEQFVQICVYCHDENSTESAVQSIYSILDSKKLYSRISFTNIRTANKYSKLFDITAQLY